MPTLEDLSPELFLLNYTNQRIGIINTISMHELGKPLIIFGIVLLIVGLFFMFSPKIPFLGKLPGDILIKKDNFTFYAPIATSILISIILTIVANLFLRK